MSEAVEQAIQGPMDSMTAFMVSMEQSLGRTLAPLEKVAEQIGGSKFGKNAKAFGSAMKGMAGASVQAWAMEQLMKLIEPFMKLLKLLEIPINTLVMLLEMFVNEIFVALLPFFIEFSLLLMELAPIFKIIGQIVGKLLAGALKLIIDRFKLIWNILKALGLWIAEKLKPIFEKLMPVFKVIGDFLKGIFIPLWNLLKKGFFLLKTAWDKSGGKLFGPDGFIALAFKGLLDFGKALVNWFIGAINNVIGLINKIPGVDIGRIPLLNQGGIVTAPTLAMLHPEEAVVPLSRAGEFGLGKDERLLAAMEENNRLMGILVKRQQEAERWQI